MTWTILVDETDYGFNMRLLISRQFGGKEFLAAPLVMREHVPGLVYTEEPTFQGSMREGRAFMQGVLDAAWKMGLRPTGAPDPVNELKAVRYHLEDMRRIAKVPGITTT